MSDESLPEEPRVVFRASNPTQASLVQNWLEDDGIHATVVGGEAAGGAFELVEVDPIVYVDASDLEKATESIKEFLASLATSNNLDEMSEAEGQFDWPMCPQCDELREAQCLHCQEISTEFSVDDAQADRSITCLKCSEITEIRLQDRCRYCQHDFVAAEQQQHVDPGGTLVPAQPDVNMRRVAIVIGIALVLVVVIFVAMNLGNPS